MSTKSFKRLTTPAKQSVSGRNPFYDGYDASEKESDAPELVDLDSTRTCASSTHSEAYGLSPAKESPSRRKKLLGSLRNMSSLRSLRSSPSREKTKDHIELSFQPESPRTPIRELTALALNLQQSPPHCLMPDILDRKPSNSSSLVVLHSSPVNIPTLVTHEKIGCAHLYGLPEGTVPDSPAPLRKALEKDPNRYSVVSDSSPARSQFGGNPELTASPMPETNLGLRDNDFDESPALSRGQEAELSMVPLEAASYFDTSMAVHSTNSNLYSVGRAAVQQKGAMILEEILDDMISYEGASTVANLYKLNKTDIHGEHVYRHDSSVTMQNSSLTEHNRTEDAKSLESTVNGQTQRDEIDPMRQETSPNNIEHIVSEDPTSSNTYHQPAHSVYLIRQPETQMSLEMQAHTLSASNSLHIIEPVPVSTAWGTRGSLYDGTGYGDASCSISTRPSTSATVPKEHTKSAVDSTHTAATVTQDPISMTRDHETLDEVIRAYAALSEEAIAGVTKDA